MTQPDRGDTGKIDFSLLEEIELTDEDIFDAMSHVSGYIDISAEDFRTIYHLAWRHALARIKASRDDAAPAGDSR